MPNRKALEQEPSSGNVFADIGLADADEHSIKAGLVVKIDRTIRQHTLTQAAAAQIMGIDQPKVSAMLAGQFRGYSVERLMRFLVALGHDVEIVVKPRRRGSGAELRVAKVLGFCYTPGRGSGAAAGTRSAIAYAAGCGR
jgi:predicted XRE-type DNA-binding protein